MCVGVVMWGKAWVGGINWVIFFTETIRTKCMFIFFYVREPYRRAHNRVNGTPERNSVRLHQMTPLCLSPRAQINQVAVEKWSRDQTRPHSRFLFILCPPRPSPRPLGNGLACQGALGVRGLDARLPRRRVPRRHLQQQRRVPPPPPIPVTRASPRRLSSSRSARGGGCPAAPWEPAYGLSLCPGIPSFHRPSWISMGLVRGRGGGGGLPAT